VSKALMGIAFLQTVVPLLIACSEPGPDTMTSDGTTECSQSAVSLGQAVGDTNILGSAILSEFRERLDRTGVDYTLSTPDSALSIPTPVCPKCRSKHYDRVMYLILERSRQLRTLQRYRIYLDGERLVCVEADFAHKNPYQS
jgi:hypothetical protein